jgi:hypothetical protein
MANKILNIDDFKAEKIDTNQQKKVRGGDPESPIDGNKEPIKGGGGIIT